MKFTKYEKITVLEGCLISFLKKPNEYRDEIIKTLLKIAKLDSNLVIDKLSTIISQGIPKNFFNFEFLQLIIESFKTEEPLLSQLFKNDSVKTYFLKRSLFDQGQTDRQFLNNSLSKALTIVLCRLIQEGDLDSAQEILTKIKKYKKQQIGEVIEAIIERTGVNNETQSLFIHWIKTIKNEDMKNGILAGSYTYVNRVFIDGLPIDEWNFELDFDESDFC